jgi:hypothetical protein
MDEPETEPDAVPGWDEWIARGGTCAWLPALLFLSLIASTSARGQPPLPTADLGVLASIVDPNTSIPGSLAELRVRVSNHGPDTARTPAVNAYTILDDVGQHVLIAGSPQTAECEYFPYFLDAQIGFPSVRGVLVETRALAPGDAVDCTVRLTIGSGARGTLVVPVLVRSGPASQDPVAANNETEVRLAFPRGSASIPEPRFIPGAGLVGLFILGMVTLGSGLLASFRRARTSFR